MKKQRMILGRYIVGDSWMHRLDPRAKILAVPLFMTAVFLVDDYTKLVVLLVFTLVVVKTTSIPLLAVARAVKPLWLLLSFIVVFHLLFESKGAQLMQVGALAFYTGGLERGVVAALRMVMFIVFAALLTFTTQPDQLAQGLGGVMAPLRRLGLRTDRLTLTLGIALRFVPTLFDEAERIWKAQISRGLDLRSQPLRRRARLLAALLIPVTAGALRRALALADAMEARGYRLDAPRSRYRSLSWQVRDSCFVVLFIAPIAAAAWL